MQEYRTRLKADVVTAKLPALTPTTPEPVTEAPVEIEPDEGQEEWCKKSAILVD